MIYQLDDLVPQIPASTYIAPNTSIIGDVVVAENVTFWFNVVVRADMAQVSIGKNTNIQDGSILHVDYGFPLIIGDNVTVGHKVMLHGCTIGESTLIGMNAVILNGAKIGKNCVIGANALVTENMVVPDGHMALGSPAKVVKEIDPKMISLFEKSAQHYVDNGVRYKKGLKKIR